MNNAMKRVSALLDDDYSNIFGFLAWSFEEKGAELDNKKIASIMCEARSAERARHQAFDGFYRRKRAYKGH